jgi:pyruvate dehydrogenase E1 component beta subunit
MLEDFLKWIIFCLFIKAAIRYPGPVVFLENEMMYGESFEVTDAEMDMDFVLPIGKANIERY